LEVSDGSFAVDDELGFSVDPFFGVAQETVKRGNVF
jgi:hypothetical protein